MSTVRSRKFRTALAASSIAASIALGAAPAGAVAAPGDGAPPHTAPGAASPTTTSSTAFVAAVTQPAVNYLRTTWKVYVHDGSEWINDALPFTVTQSCTGFVVDPSGYIVTAGHCLDQAAAIEEAVAQAVARYSGKYTWDDGTVLSDQELFAHGMANWTFEGQGTRSEPDRTVEVWLSEESGGDVLPARVIEVSPLDGGTDIALIKIEASNLPTVELAAEAPTVGDPIISVGYPASTEEVTDPQSAPSFMMGNVTSVRTRSAGLLPVYEIDAAMTNGMSGGPTVDQWGRVVGLNSFGHRAETLDIGFVQPLSLISEMLSRHGIEAGGSDLVRQYRSAVEAFFAADHAAAVEGFDVVLAAWPDNEIARSYRADAAAALAAAADPRSSGGGAATTTNDPARGLPNPEAAGAATASEPRGSTDVGGDVVDHGSERNPYQLLGYLVVVLLVPVGLAAAAFGLVRTRHGRGRNVATAGFVPQPPPPSEAASSMA